MTETPYGRLLAIKAAAAGPYRIAGRCADCGEEEGVVAFQRPFSTAIAICRRCRFVRTGVEDRRGMIRATATIDEEWARAERRARHMTGRADDQPIGRGLDVLIPKSVFARAIVPEAERSPSLVEAPEDPDVALDRMIADAEAAEVDDVFREWDDDVDDVKRR